MARTCTYIIDTYIKMYCDISVARDRYVCDLNKAFGLSAHYGITSGYFITATSYTYTPLYIQLLQKYGRLYEDRSGHFLDEFH